MTRWAGDESGTRLLASVQQTEEAGRALGRALAAFGAPVVVGLAGPLGAGKTHFARGVVAGIDAAAAREVASPTYAIVHSYETSPPLHHLDLYRLEGEDDLESVGFWELLEDVVIVEWPDRIGAVDELVDVACALSGQGDDPRTLRMVGRSDRGHAVIAKLSST